MPLHDWSKLSGWEGVHDIWLVELLPFVKPKLPPGYRAHLGTSPALEIGTPAEKPNIAVRHWQEGNGAVASSSPGSQWIKPDLEGVATLTFDPDLALLITYHGKLSAAIEIISPANKDRPSSRVTYLGRYFGYLKVQASVLLVDVHPQPFGFSFADALAAELALQQPPLPCPMAIAYRVGGPAPTGGTVVGTWPRSLTPGKPLPTLPLSLSDESQIQVDLEGTYSRAAADAYLE